MTQNNPPRPIRFSTLAALVIPALATSAFAQVGASIIAQPWDTAPHWADTLDEPLFQTRGHLAGSGADFRLFRYLSEGRVKPQRDTADPDFIVGYKILMTDFNTDSPLLPGSYNDIALSGALRLGEIDKDIELWIQGGAGTANDGHFDFLHAIYAMGGIHVRAKLDEQSVVNAGISYQGNRAILPDIPLPYVSYTRFFDKTLSFTVGLPVSSVTWKPLEHLVLEAQYLVPDGFAGRASYFITEDFSIYAESRQEVDAFYRKDMGDTRMFYQASRVGGGVQVDLFEKTLKLNVGGGWSFNQDITTGFDLRNDKTVARPNDVPYFFARIIGTF